MTRSLRLGATVSDPPTSVKRRGTYTPVCRGPGTMPQRRIRARERDGDGDLPLGTRQYLQPRSAISMPGMPSHSIACLAFSYPGPVSNVLWARCCARLMKISDDDA